jgi:hypothetical protein
VTAWVWEVADDADAVHALLCASDAKAASDTGTPAPVRGLDSTRSRVGERAVHLLRADGEPAGMFTLTPFPPYDRDLAIFPAATRPLYLQRLAVDPGWAVRAPVVGLQCVRRAIEVATAAGADALRAEANPDLARVVSLLELCGFRPCGPPESSGGVRRLYLQMPLGL